VRCRGDRGQQRITERRVLTRLPATSMVLGVPSEINTDEYLDAERRDRHADKVDLEEGVASQSDGHGGVRTRSLQPGKQARVRRRRRRLPFVFARATGVTVESPVPRSRSSRRPRPAPTGCTCSPAPGTTTSSPARDPSGRRRSRTSPATWFQRIEARRLRSDARPDDDRAIAALSGTSRRSCRARRHA
jgi:hypothetical protein